MKKYIFLVLALVATQVGSAQILKDIGRGIKRDAEYRVEQRARDAARKSIDSLEKKIKKKEKKAATKTATTEENRFPEQEKAETKGEEGFITLDLSTPVTTKGLSVTISGASIKYDKWNAVKLVIKGPKEEEEVSVPLNDSSKYHLVYDRLLEDGDYIITATSSDGKAKIAERLWVMDWYQPQDETKDLMDVTGQAFHRLKEKVDALEPMLSPKDRITLHTKMGEVKLRLDALHTLLNDLKKAKEEIGDLGKSAGIRSKYAGTIMALLGPAIYEIPGKVPSKNIRENLALLNQMLTAKTAEIKNLQEITNHEPYDNSECEYIAMLNEACSAFSTITNAWTKTLTGVIKNIILDKAVPKAVEYEIKNKREPLGDKAEWGAKEASKIYATAIIDAESLSTKIGKAGIAGDVVQFATDVLMKKYCGVFKGTITHYYNFISKNEQGKSWWDYAVHSEAAITLRYPKNNRGIIKMKGTIEGNATKFAFYADPKQNAEYAKGTAGKVKTMMIKSVTPYSLPFSSSLHDELGFGMLARLMVTPAYFVIRVDAEYNTQTGKIKLFINDALADYTPQIVNLQFFVQWVAGLPKLRMMYYPISKAKLTMKAALKDNDEFLVHEDEKGDLIFAETVKRHIGAEADDHEHFLDFTISAKKEKN